MPGGPFTTGTDVARAERAPTRVLFVCTANQCRSVMAEAIARRRFAGRPFVFESAGLLGGGRPMPPSGILVAGENGFELSHHLSKSIDPSRLDEHDVILTMTREHTRELVAHDGGLWPRVFTLPQFARWVEAHPPEPHVDLRSWIETVGAGRARAEMVGARPSDDVADPVDGPPEEWRQLVNRLSADIDRIATRLIPTRSTGSR